MRRSVTVTIGGSGAVVPEGSRLPFAAI